MGCSLGRKNDIPSVAEDIRDKYAISNELLGRGSFGQVRIAVNFSTGVVCAVKIIQRDNKVGEWSNENMFRTEVDVIRNLQHEHVIKFYEVYEDTRFLYVVMEKCDGGEVFDKIRELKRFGEGDASKIGQQMLSGLAYIHSVSVIHRDIKAENYLFKSKDAVFPLRLIDFGMAKRKRSNEHLNGLCGSPHYLSPELIGQRYQEPTDIWSFGVLMFLMLYGRYPFDGNTPEEIMRRILQGKINWTHSCALSPLALSFLKRCIEKDASKRIEARHALRHEWIVTKKHEICPTLPQEIRAAAHSVSKIRFCNGGITAINEFQAKLSEADEDFSRGRRGSRLVTQEEIEEISLKKRARSGSVFSTMGRAPTNTELDEGKSGRKQQNRLSRISSFVVGGRVSDRISRFTQLMGPLPDLQNEASAPNNGVMPANRPEEGVFGLPPGGTNLPLQPTLSVPEDKLPSALGSILSRSSSFATTASKVSGCTQECGISYRQLSPLIEVLSDQPMVVDGEVRECEAPPQRLTPNSPLSMAQGSEENEDFDRMPELVREHLRPLCSSPSVHPATSPLNWASNARANQSADNISVRCLSSNRENISARCITSNRDMHQMTGTSFIHSNSNPDNAGNLGRRMSRALLSFFNAPEDRQWSKGSFPRPSTGSINHMTEYLGNIQEEVIDDLSAEYQKLYNPTSPTLEEFPDPETPRMKNGSWDSGSFEEAPQPSQGTVVFSSSDMIEESESREV